VWRNRVCDPNFKQPTEPGKSPFTFIAENPPMTPVSVSDDSMAPWRGVIGIFPEQRAFLETT
jgi:hypothetical protein